MECKSDDNKYTSFPLGSTWVDQIYLPFSRKQGHITGDLHSITDRPNFPLLYSYQTNHPKVTSPHQNHSNTKSNFLRASVLQG
ncbi:hypothetical protein H5410_059488 [Solanum commersonii]|uniref:Uncharacterized protein n=1 Tax=Solanum commersonii TaxID=4109 RepID=A0A9J5W2N9_SOLCO|nr:hypothetical protein H5410_059488 [Solanum commersonii]